MTQQRGQTVELSEELVGIANRALALGLAYVATGDPDEKEGVSATSSGAFEAGLDADA